MAINQDCPGLEVQVFVDGDALEEYDDRAEVPPKMVARFVEAESGKEFEIRYRFTHPFPSDRPVSTIITVDGQDVDEPLVRPEELYDVHDHVSQGPISKNYLGFSVQKYRFSPLIIEEGGTDPVSEAEKEQVEPVGTITLDFYFLEMTRLNKRPKLMEKEVHDLGVVREKAIKGETLSHAVSLAEAEPTEDVMYFDAEYADDGKPFATFQFHYRSLDALKDLHIVRRSSELVDLADCNEDVIRRSSQAEIQAMIARWQRQEQIHRMIKRERSSSSTVIGYDEGNRFGNEDNEVVEIGAVDLKRKRLRRRLPTAEDEVIELD